MKLNELIAKYGDIEITEEQEKELKDKLGIKEKKSKSWKPDYGDGYWFIADNGVVVDSVWTGATDDVTHYVLGNCFKTQEEANLVIEKLIVIAELKRFAEEHNEHEIGWRDGQQLKWYLYYNYDEEKVWCDFRAIIKNNLIYFTSEKIAEQAIEAIGADRLKKYYFEVKE